MLLIIKGYQSVYASISEELRSFLEDDLLPFAIVAQAPMNKKVALEAMVFSGDAALIERKRSGDSNYSLIQTPNCKMIFTTVLVTPNFIRIPKPIL